MLNTFCRLCGYKLPRKLPRISKILLQDVSKVGVTRQQDNHTFTRRRYNHTYTLNATWNLVTRHTKPDMASVTRQQRYNHTFTWNAAIEKYVDDMMFKYQKLNEKLMDSQNLTPKELKYYSSELHQLKPAVKAYNVLKKKREDLLELAILAIEDDDFKTIMEEESPQYQTEIRQLESDVIDLIVPSDKDDGNNVVLEVRSATGGKEAAIFASEVFSMYIKFCSFKHWKFDLLTMGENIEGGLKDATASISGKNVFGVLKHEIGVHRVQRVPSTESLGRVHTSTITVAVLPQPEDLDVVLNMADVKVDTYRSSGAGGQHVNTTDSAVRVTHNPTGISVAIQDERSQLKNKHKALQLLTARIYERQRARSMKERSDERKTQIGTGHRSERIRTYNLSQDRVTDHRIGVTLHGFNDFLTGGESLSELLEKLTTQHKMDSIGEITNMKPSIRL